MFFFLLLQRTLFSQNESQNFENIKAKQLPENQNKAVLKSQDNLNFVLEKASGAIFIILKTESNC